MFLVFRKEKKEFFLGFKLFSYKLPVPSIPKDRLNIKFTRSSGPGGQNVNK